MHLARNVTVAAIALVTVIASAPAAQATTVSTRVTKPFSTKVTNHRAQSFGYDNDSLSGDGYIYLAQPTGGDDAVAKGNFAISRVLNKTPSTTVDSITLNGFGHGTNIGVEPPDSTGTSHVWVEAGPLVKTDGAVYGTRIARLPYHPGHTYTNHDKSVTESAGKNSWTLGLVPQPTVTCGGSSAVKSAAPSIDPSTGRVAFRFRVGGKTAIRVYNIGDAASGNMKNQAAIEGSRCVSGSMDLGTFSGQKFSFQGFTLFGNQIHAMMASTTQYPKIRFATYNIDGSGQTLTVEDVNDTLKTGLGDWEAEGVAVRRTNGKFALRWGMTGYTGGKAKLAVFQRP